MLKGKKLKTGTGIVRKLKDVLCSEAFRRSQICLKEGNEKELGDVWKDVKQFEEAWIKRRAEDGMKMDRFMHDTFIRLCKDSDEYGELFQDMLEMPSFDGWTAWECWEIARIRGNLKTALVLENFLKRGREVSGNESGWNRLPWRRGKQAIESSYDDLGNFMRGSRPGILDGSNLEVQFCAQGRECTSRDCHKMHLSDTASRCMRLVEGCERILTLSDMVKEVQRCSCLGIACLKKHKDDPDNDLLFHLCSLNEDKKALLEELERRLGSIKQFKEYENKVEMFSEDGTRFVNLFCWKKWKGAGLEDTKKVSRINRNHACMFFLLVGVWKMLVFGLTKDEWEEAKKFQKKFQLQLRTVVDFLQVLSMSKSNSLNSETYLWWKTRGPPFDFPFKVCKRIVWFVSL